jgi:hypothetical protein
VALLAAFAKLAIVNIIARVAADACGSQRGRRLSLRSRCIVATFAAGTLVSAFQTIVGTTVVVKIPERPGPCVVTGFAAHSEPQFVFVLILVAGVAVLRCVFVTVCFVTALAGRGHMAASQGESGGSVVKGCRFPCLVRVTLRALDA